MVFGETNDGCRYEVQDPEPDELGGHGKIYKTTAKDLIPIPKESAGLPAFPVGKHVLARYPETTTFYKAEVMGTKVFPYATTSAIQNLTGVPARWYMPSEIRRRGRSQQGARGRKTVSSGHRREVVSRPVHPRRPGAYSKIGSTLHIPDAPKEHIRRYRTMVWIYPEAGTSPSICCPEVAAPR